MCDFGDFDVCMYVYVYGWMDGCMDVMAMRTNTLQNIQNMENEYVDDEYIHI